MALRRLREKEAVNYKELHCGKPIAFGKRERKAKVLSESFEVERIIAQRTQIQKGNYLFDLLQIG
jgi:hypothetical protein